MAPTIVSVLLQSPRRYQRSTLAGLPGPRFVPFMGHGFQSRQGAINAQRNLQKTHGMRIFNRDNFPGSAAANLVKKARPMRDSAAEVFGDGLAHVGEG